jgi:hypothetical protein
VAVIEALRPGAAALGLTTGRRGSPGGVPVIEALRPAYRVLPPSD